MTQQPGSAETGEAFDQQLHAAVAEAMRHAFVPGMTCDDEDSPYPFVDLMSHGGSTIATGEDRIKEFAETITFAVLENLDGSRPSDTLRTENAQLQAQVEAMRKDAERYRWLRLRDWFNDTLCVLRDPKKVLTRGSMLGADCPSRERLDAAIDEAMKP